jgi:hypothetical protein
MDKGLINKENITLGLALVALFSSDKFYKLVDSAVLGLKKGAVEGLNEELSVEEVE